MHVAMIHARAVSAWAPCIGMLARPSLVGHYFQIPFCSFEFENDHYNVGMFQESQARALAAWRHPHPWRTCHLTVEQAAQGDPHPVR